VSSPTKTVGVIGGMGPAAAVDFFRRIVDSTDAERDQDHLHVLIDNQPAVPDRTAWIKGEGPDPAPILIESAQRLEAAGADFLVMACNTAYVRAEVVAESVGVPLVNWVEVVAAAVRRQMPQGGTVALLATEGTIASGLYQSAFAAVGLGTMLPDAAEQGVISAAIYGPNGVKAGTADLTPMRTAVDRVGAHLAAGGANAAVLACTELSVLYPTPPGWRIPVFDAAQIVAEYVIELAGGKIAERKEEPSAL